MALKNMKVEPGEDFGDALERAFRLAIQNKGRHEFQVTHSHGGRALTVTYREAVQEYDPVAALERLEDSIIVSARHLANATQRMQDQRKWIKRYWPVKEEGIKPQ